MLFIQNISPYLTKDNISLLIVASLSIFMMYKSVQIMAGGLTPSSPTSGPTSLSSPSISTSSESAASTVVPIQPLYVPDPTPLMVPDPTPLIVEHWTPVFERVGDVFMMFMGF